MRKFILSTLLLASAFQTAKAEQSGDWTFTVSNNQATIISYAGWGVPTGPLTVPSSLFSSISNTWIPVVGIGQGTFQYSSITAVSIPNGVTSIGSGAFANCPSLASVIIPNSVRSIGSDAFYNSPSLASVSIPNGVTSIGSGAFASCPSLASVSIPNSVTSIGSGAFSNSALGSVFLSPNLSSSQITQAGFPSTAVFYVGSVGAPTSMATQAELATTQAELASTKAELATTKSQITTAINEGKASGIASVTASPNTWSLFTTSQIQNMAVGDLVLTRQVGGGFVLNYDIEQSTDLQTWTTYAPLSLPLTGLPTDKAFVRIKAKQ